jgi:hypothetical protein
MKAIFTSIAILLLSSIAFSQQKSYINQDVKNPQAKTEVVTQNFQKPTPLIRNYDSKSAVQRKPLHEVFTSSTCGYCPAANAAIDAVALSPANYDDCTVIKYQVSWPGAGDPYNTPEIATRRNYYNVTGVPDFYVDANNDSGNSYTQTKFNNYASVDAYFDIDATHTIEGNTISVDITITPYMTWAGKCRVAVVEKTTYYNAASNGETEFHNVMMKMLPNPAGTSVSLTDGTPYEFNVSGDLSSTFIEEMWDLEVVIFLQDDTNKDVMQSNYSEFLFVNTNLILSEASVTNTYTDCNLGEEETISIEVFNFGPDPINNIDVSYTIDGGTAVEEEITTAIPSMESATYTFTQTADLSEIGCHQIDISIAHPDDVSTDNNTYTTYGTSGDASITLDIILDNYGSETSWQFEDDVNGAIIASGSGYTNSSPDIHENICVLSTHCYTFTIFDGYGDGICCQYGNGSYTLTYFGEEIASGGSFTTQESASIDAVLDITYDDEIWFCTGETISWETDGIGAFSHEASEIDNLTPGNTTVTYTINEGTDCETSTSFDIVVVDNTIDITNDDIEVCVGQTIVLPDGSGLFNPATVDNMTAATTNVTYTVNEGMSCENSTNFDVIVNALPTIDISCEDILFCASETVVFPEGTGTFEPSTATAPETDITYTTVASAEGCINTCEFTIDIIEDEIDITAENISVCQGELIEFFGGTNGVYNPTTVDNMTAGTTTVQYIVAGTTECENILEFDVTVLETPTAQITVNAEHMLSTDATGTLQWYFNDAIIDGATESTYQCTEDGDYYLMITSDNDCSAQSNTLNVTGTASGFEAYDSIKIYPNPATDKVTITNADNCDLYIYNVSGQLIKTINNSGNKKLDIDTQSLASGHYTIKVIKEEMVTIKQFVIKK